MTKSKLKILNMHCTSCAMSIDWGLEDAGAKAKTNYAKAETEVTYDPKKLTLDQIVKIIKNVGYDAKPI
jgi:copper chaperone